MPGGLVVHVVHESIALDVDAYVIDFYQFPTGFRDPGASLREKLIKSDPLDLGNQVRLPYVRHGYLSVPRTPSAAPAAPAP